MIDFSSDTAILILSEYCERSGELIITGQCSLCSYQLGYRWIKGQLFFDAGCDCLKIKLLEPREPKELLEFFEADQSRISQFKSILELITH